MSVRYRGWATSERMKEAIRQHLEDGLSQSEAAKRLGVSRSRLNTNVGAARKRTEDAEARVAASRAEKVAAAPETAAVAVTNESVVPQMIVDSPAGSQPLLVQTRRVGTFREFNERYFGNEICLDVETPVATPDGWARLGDIQVGDKVFAPDGSPTAVTHLIPQRTEVVFKVQFASGAELFATADHRWRVRRRQSMISTADMLRLGLRTGYSAKWSVELPDPVELPETELPIAPYTLGLWLGDGSKSQGEIASHDDDAPEARAAVELDGFITTDQKKRQTFGVLGLTTQLRSAGVLRNKHIPAVYLRASVKQRLALLQGLMDSDGTVDDTGQCEFVQLEGRLIDEVAELLSTLGVRFHHSDHSSDGAERLRFFTDLGVFRLTRKAERLSLALATKRYRKTFDPIVSIVPAGERVVSCVTVAHPSEMFLAGERLTPTGNCPDCGVHHDTPEFHGQIMDLMEDRDRRLKLINMAPYHGKSSTATLKSTLYEIVRDPSSRTALISRAAPLAEAFLYQIKQHLVDTDLYEGAAGNLIDDWGPFYNANHWSNNQIYIAGRSGAQKEPTISVYGFGAQIYGRRFDRMIFDDVADLENSNTPEQVAKMYKKIWQEYVNRTGKTGQVAWVGTRVAPGDIYSLLDDVEGMNVLRFPCILDEEDRAMLWPEHFPYSSAHQFRTAMTEAEFQLVYQNVDMPGMGASFTQEVMDRSHDTERVIGQWDPAWALMLGVDPAGAGAQSGYTAMICMGVDLNTGRRHLVDVINQKAMKAPQMLAQIVEWSERYSPREARVEVNGLQSQLLQYNDELNRKLSNAGVRIVPHITHRGNKWDPQFGVEAMSTLYHNNLISTPWADANSRKKFGALEQQLMQFPMGKVTDMVMAMWFASLSATEVFKRTQLPMFDSRAKVPGRIRRRRGVIDFGDSTVRAPTREEENSSLHPQAMALPPARFVNVPGDVLAGV